MGCGLVLLIRACYSGAGSCLTYCLPAAKLKSPNLSNPFKHWQMKRRHIVENLCSRGNKARSTRVRVQATMGQRGPAASTHSPCLLRKAGGGFAPAAMPSLGTGDIPSTSAEGFNRGASSPHWHDLAEGRGWWCCCGTRGAAGARGCPWFGTAGGRGLGETPPALQHGWWWSPGLSRKKGDSILVCGQICSWVTVWSGARRVTHELLRSAGLRGTRRLYWNITGAARGSTCASRDHHFSSGSFSPP